MWVAKGWVTIALALDLAAAVLAQDTLRLETGYFSGISCPTGHLVIVTEAVFGNTGGNSPCQLPIQGEDSDYYARVMSECGGQQSCATLDVPVDGEMWCPGTIFVADSIDYVQITYTCEQATFTVRRELGYLFNAICPTGHVVRVTEAVFGNTGGRSSCELPIQEVDTDYYARVMSECDGQQSCATLDVPVDGEMFCPGTIFVADSIDYVQITYTCQEALTDQAMVRESFVASPLYGAVNATINMTLTHPGLNSTGAMRVFIGQKIDSILLERNATHLKVQIPKVSSSLAGSTYPIIIQYDAARRLETGLNFTFVKVDIEKVFPLRSIIRGGISQTVMGRYLDTVTHPQMVITMVLWTLVQQREVFYGECDVRDSTLMVCFTPTMNLSEEVKTILRRDQIPTVTSGTIGGQIGATGGQTGAPPTLADPILLFYVGFDLEHDNGFANLSEVASLRQNSTLNVSVTSPTVFPFDDVIECDPADVVNMKGENLDVNVGQADYIIDIGQGHAEILLVTHSTLSHRLPKQEPAPRSGDKNGDLQVIVHVGRNIHINVGKLRYKKFPLVTVVASLVAGVLLLATAMTAGYVWRKRKQRQDAAPKDNAERGNAALVENNMGILTLKDVKDIYPEWACSTMGAEC